MMTTIRKVQQLVGRFFNDPPVDEPVDAAVGLADRQATVAALAAERGRYGQEVQQLEARQSAARARREEAERELARRREDEQAVEQARWAAMAQHDAEVRRLEARLRAGAPPALAEAISWINTVLTPGAHTLVRARTGTDSAIWSPVPDVVPEPTYAPRTTPGNPLSGQPPRETIASDSPSIERRRAGLRAARRELEAMALQALGDEELRARIERLLETVPPVEPLMRDGRSPLTAGEMREVAWRAGRTWEPVGSEKEADG